ncbi:MAG: laccase domain-containing protein [Desulfovibrionaceae bacterium]|nr:laccase domain-containing protein [Desulfovibrionaceae bacterium]
MKYKTFDFPGVPGVRAAFTGKDPSGRDIDAQGNLSFALTRDPKTVLANRLRLRGELGFSRWSSLRQAHGTRIAFDPRGSTLETAATAEGDGLATGEPGLALAVKSADCQPILLAHASGRFVCALHVGWRGNRAGFPASGAAAFCDRYGLGPADVLAVRGPSLSPTASEFRNFDLELGPGFAGYFTPETRTVDLWRLTRDQLIQAGLKSENIFGVDDCTYSDPGYFSYRRDKITGRQAGLIWIEE